jgi:hypothetical protein
MMNYTHRLCVGEFSVLRASLSPQLVHIHYYQKPPLNLNTLNRRVLIYSTKCYSFRGTTVKRRWLRSQVLFGCAIPKQRWLRLRVGVGGIGYIYIV